MLHRDLAKGRRKLSHYDDRRRSKSLEARVAVRAHELWVRRGCPPGDGLQDWFDAQAELEMEHERESYQARVALYE